MIKKFIMCAAIGLLLGGVVWAQGIDPDDIPSRGGLVIFDNVPFDAVPTLSTEARYSAGIFTSDVDNFIDPRFHNPEIGTFFFLGGFPAAGNVNDTVVVTPTPFAVSFGFARTINENLYIAAYYLGSFNNARGTRNDDDTNDIRWRSANHRNNLALLLGMNNMGFRFDMVMNTDTERNTIDGDLAGTPPAGGRTRTNGPSFALTWGAQNIGLEGLAPYVRIGYRFPDLEAIGDGTGNEAVARFDGAMALFAGAEYALSDTQAIGGELSIGFAFPDRVSGDDEILGSNDGWRRGGGFGIGLNAYYSQTFEADIVSFGFSPWLDMGFTRFSNNDSRVDFDAPGTSFFTLGVGIDLGLRVTPTPRLAFFTGAGLQFFEWNTQRLSGGDMDGVQSAWRFDGLEWDSRRTAAGGNLGFGMTFTPIPNIVIGAGLNTILDRFVLINLERMQISRGTWFADDPAGGKNNFLREAASIFDTVTFDLTVSVAVGPDGFEPREPRERRRRNQADAE